MSPRARRRCGRQGCDEIAPCPVHTPKPWAGSTRRATLPSNWSSITAVVLAEEPTCQLAYDGTWWTRSGPTSCTVDSTEVDHIVDRLDHSRANLRGVCSACHRRRTQQQAGGRRG